MSALLTTTMTYMKTVVDGFEEAGLGQIKMAVGGAPISQMYADEIGADGYGQNASAAVDLFLPPREAETQRVVDYQWPRRRRPRRRVALRCRGARRHPASRPRARNRGNAGSASWR